MMPSDTESHFAPNLLLKLHCFFLLSTIKALRRQAPGLAKITDLGAPAEAWYSGHNLTKASSATKGRTASSRWLRKKSDRTDYDKRIVGNMQYDQ
jgi:hypothetical protein